MMDINRKNNAQSKYWQIRYQIMQKTRRNPSKTELLDWANLHLPYEIPKHTKIQELGNGVAYLYILNGMYPGCLSGLKFIKKPTSEYDCLNNLKFMINVFQKVGIRQPVDITKLSKLRFQQNLNLLQWFYQHEQKIKTNPPQELSNSLSISMSRSKNAPLKIPQKLILNKPDKSHKMEIEELGEQLKTMISPTKCLNHIRQIVNNQNMGDSQNKLNRIKQILLLPKSTCRNSQKNKTENSAVYKKSEKREEGKDMELEDQIREEDPIKKQLSESHSVVSEKSHSLEERYQSYLKSTYKHPRQSIRISQDRKQIYEYEQQRLTDASILLNCSPSNKQNSSRKSVVSQTDLLGQ